MKKTIALIAALLAACGTETQDPAQPYRDALPKAQAAKLGTYQDAGATPGALTVARQPLGDSSLAQSEYAVTSYFLALSVNGGAKLILDLVQLITAFPPAACDDAHCTWGPWVGDQGLNRYKLDVTKQGAAYAYALSGQNAVAAGAPFVDLLTGTAYPVDREHGSGTFTLDFEAAAAGLAHGPAWEQKDFGRLVLDYDNTAAAPTVTAEFIGARNQDPANPHRMNAAYAFVAAASGGELQVAFENLDTTETFTLRTRWSASGQGRCDAVYTAAGGGSLTASECWAGHSQDYAEVYDTKHLDVPGLADASACSPFSTFVEADLSLPQP